MDGKSIDYWFDFLDNVSRPEMRPVIVGGPELLIRTILPFAGFGMSINESEVSGLMMPKCNTGIAIKDSVDKRIDLL